MRVLENEFLRVEVADHGAELSRVFDKKKGQEDLFDGNPLYWNRHAPILFPFVGKVNGGVYRYDGCEYPMGQHGFARDMEFTLVLAEADKVVHRLESSAETLAKYPFPFVLEVTHLLRENELTIQWRVMNPGEQEMLYSIGAHPAFACPVIPGTKRSDYSIRLDEEVYSYSLIDPETSCVDMDKKRVLKPEGGILPIRDDLFEEDAMIFDGFQIDRISILYPDGSDYVVMECPGAPSFGIWSKPGTVAPFVCLEPWMGRCDNKGFTGELKDKYYIQSLAAGASQKYEYRLRFF